METRANYVIVGIFTLAAILAAFAFVYWTAAVGDRGETTVLRVRIPGSASGLGRGSAVLFNGVRVGDVRRVYIDVQNPRVAIADTEGGSGRLRGPDAFLQAEVKRIRRMQCDDFLWEYERMQEIAHGFDLDQEYLFQTSLAMVEAHSKLNANEIERVLKKNSAVLKDTAKSCRANPGARYFADAYQPAVLKRAGR